MRELIREYNTRHFKVAFYVDGGEEGSPWFRDLYTECEHEGGISIQAPYHRLPYCYHGGPKFYRGQYTPAELASEYAKLGIRKPECRSI